MREEEGEDEAGRLRGEAEEGKRRGKRERVGRDEEGRGWKRRAKNWRNS